MTFTTLVFLPRDWARRVVITVEGTGVAARGWRNNGHTWL